MLACLDKIGFTQCSARAAFAVFVPGPARLRASVPTNDKLFSIESSGPLVKFIREEVQRSVGTSPEHLGGFTGFRLGASSIDAGSFVDPQAYDDALSALGSSCERWHSHATASKWLLLIVGSADRLPLKGKSLSQYKANSGLARARGEAVRRYLRENCPVAKSQMGLRPESTIVLDAGPRATPPQSLGAAEAQGFPTDRGVEVWMIVADLNETK